MPLPGQAGSQGAQLPFLEAHGHKGSNSNRAPSFESHLSRRSFEQQFDQVEEQPAPSSAEGDTVGVLGRTAAESLANPGQGVGQQTLSSGRGQHTPVNTGQQESGAAAQEQREGPVQAEGIAAGGPHDEGGKVLGSSHAASKTASTSNTSGRFGLIPDEVLHAFRELQRNSGSEPSRHVQEGPGSTPISTEVEPLEVVGERPIGGKSHDRVPPAVDRAAAAHGLNLRQIASTEASDSATLESNLPQVERPNQASPHPGDVSREGLSGAISSELPSETLPARHGAAVGQKPSLKPVAISETPAPAGQKVPEVSPLTGLPPNDSASFRAAFGVALPITPEPVPTPRKSNAQASEQQETRGLGPLSTNTRQTNLPRLPHSAAELSIETQLDGSNTDRLVGPGSKLRAATESSKLPKGEAHAKVPQGTRQDTHVEFRRVAQVTRSGSDNRSVTGRSSHKPPQGVVSTQVAAVNRGDPNDSRAANLPIPLVRSTQPAIPDRGAADTDPSNVHEPGTGSRGGTSSGTAVTKTSASENAVDLSTLSKPARSGDRTPSPMVNTAAPVARSEVAAISHTPAEAKASFVLPGQSSAQNVDAASPRTEAYPEASSTASRVRSVERLVDMAALHRKIDSNQMNLLLSDNRIGRMSVRLVERGGVIDTLVRTDSTRASHLFTEGLPSLLESLAQRGLQASNSGAGHFLNARDDAQPQHGGRYRPPRHPHRQNRRGGSGTARVFRLAFE